MNIRSSILNAVAVLVLVMGCATFVRADSSYTYGGDFNLPIPANPGDTNGWMDDAIIEIEDSYTIYDLDVGITVTHTRVFDLQVFLQSPTGTQLVLNMYDFDQYFEGTNYTQTIFDDEAQVPIEQATPPFTGRFRPKTPNLLQVFDGQNTYGQWRLKIYDVYQVDTGTLNKFELMVTIPEPATATLLILGTSIITLFKRRRDN